MAIFKTKIGRALLTIAILTFFLAAGYHIYNRIERNAWCNQFMENYLKNPPKDINEYTQKDFAFNELCSF